MEHEYILTSNGELYHYGVKGMRWGHRKKQYGESDIAANVRSTREAYKTAKKEYNKSFDKAYNKSMAAWSPSKKHREANDKRWEDAFMKADKANEAQSAYKEAKKTRKDAIKSTTDKLRKEATLGEKLTYNDATRRKAAKYVVDNNMSVAEATKRAQGDAWRNTALMVAGYGAVTLATLYVNR